MPTPRRGRRYYGAKSTPSTFFNGANKGSGGGAMGAAENKYNAYRKLIDPLLEAPAEFKIVAAAKRVGDKIEIKAGVIGLKKSRQGDQAAHGACGGNNQICRRQQTAASTTRWFVPCRERQQAWPVTEQSLLTSASVDLNDLRSDFC